MHLAELVYETVKCLPESAAQNALDFARLLAQREASKEDGDLLRAEQSALVDWDNPDDDAWIDAPTG